MSEGAEARQQAGSGFPRCGEHIVSGSLDADKGGQQFFVVAVDIVEVEPLAGCARVRRRRRDDTGGFRSREIRRVDGEAVAGG